MIHNINNFLLISRPAFLHTPLPWISTPFHPLQDLKWKLHASGTQPQVQMPRSGTRLQARPNCYSIDQSQVRVCPRWPVLAWPLCVCVLEREILAAICSTGISPRPSRLTTCCKSCEWDKGNQKVTRLYLCMRCL